jgi:NAD(P)-dependent dehydrogenase (short-subunit alcohol dehydrogenase family)
VSGSGRFLEGRHAVVTGGGKGIGLAVAIELARLGAHMTIMGRDVAALEGAAAELRRVHHVEAIAARCDVSDEPSISAAFGAARAEFGEPYVLVNNAGQAAGLSFAETSSERWDELLKVNLTGPFLCTREVLGAMVTAGEGRVISIASVAGLKGVNKAAAYCASKHGVIGMTRALALEVAKAGVTVNAVCPGYTETDMVGVAVDTIMRTTGKSEAEARKLVVRTIPRGSIIEPREVANAVAWLCSPDATAITGQSIVVAGGEVM